MVSLLIAGLAGTGIGFLLAVPAIGPVSLSVLRSSLTQGRRAGIYVALGAALVDALLCFLALFATGFLGMLIGFAGMHPILSLLLQLSCVGLLIGYGILQLQQKRSFPAPPELSQHPVVAQLLRRGHFFVGMGMALTNIANPTFPSSLAYIAVIAHEFQLVRTEQWWSLTAFAAGFGAGNLCWLALLAYGIHHFRRYLRGEAMERLRHFVGIALIGLGTLLGIRILTAVRWHDVLRLLPAF